MKIEVSFFKGDNITLSLTEEEFNDMALNLRTECNSDRFAYLIYNNGNCAFLVRPCGVKYVREIE